VILLDTSAVIWIDQDHARTRRLMRQARRLYISPASLLELQCLLEAGRIRLRDATLGDLADSPRWLVDDPPAAAWFDEAIGVGWTRDPFDRLIVAHARLRGWRLATADEGLLQRLPEANRVAI
jgi:PIN domain nuclease of toxin-antitoxin system